MIIKMLTSLAGPEYNYKSGNTVDHEDKEAQAWIKNGIATKATPAEKLQHEEDQKAKKAKEKAEKDAANATIVGNLNRAKEILTEVEPLIKDYKKTNSSNIKNAISERLYNAAQLCGGDKATVKKIADLTAVINPPVKKEENKK